MTGFSVTLAFTAHSQTMSRLAYRTAYYHRTAAKNFPRSEESMFPKKKQTTKQTLADQFAMAKFITASMSKEVH